MNQGMIIQLQKTDVGYFYKYKIMKKFIKSNLDDIDENATKQ